MESVFQNCVSEFDLNLFEQTTNVNQATPLCPVSRRFGVARIKDRLRGVSQVVQKAKHTNGILLEVQKELLDTKQELEETRNLLFQKNEEHKTICDERSTYFNQTTEYSKEIENMKEQLKSYGELDYDTKLKDKIISGYSDQMKGLQTELDNLMDEKKQNEKSASIALKQAKVNKFLVEKKIVRLLKEYVVPSMKKRDRWLDTIIKLYLPGAQKEEESNKVEKTDNDVEKQDETGIDDEESSTQPILQRNTSSDFDYVGSVDTGRGSSLAFSDGEKSFHSPDYSMDGSPPCTISNIICNKCKIPKSDMSTSPISPERSGIAGNSAAKICERCVLISMKDACTSPIPLEKLDTSNVTIETITHRKDLTSNSEENKPTHLTIGNISQLLTRTPDKKDSASSYNEVSSNHTSVSNKELFTTSKKLHDFTFDTDDEDYDVANDGSGFASPVEKSNTSSPVHFEQVETNSQIISSKEEPTAVMAHANIRLDANDSNKNFENVIRNQSHVGESPIISTCGIETASSVQLEEEILSTSLKLQDSTASDTEHDEVMDNMNLVKKSHMFSPIDFDDTASNCTNIDSYDPPVTPTKLLHNTPDSKMSINRNTQPELECLELNNSNNCSKDVDVDSEIRTILDKMRLRLPIITPMPASPSPPRRNLRSTENQVVNRNTMFSQQTELIAKTINEQINLLRTKVQEVFTPFVDTIPQCLEQIPRIFCHGDLENEELLRNLLHDHNRSYETPKLPSYNAHTDSNTHKLPSYNALAELNDRRQPDVVDLNKGSMLCITERNENQEFTCNDYTIIEEEEEVEAEDQITGTQHSNILHDEVCRQNKEVSQVVKNNKMSNAPLLKAEESDNVAGLNLPVLADNSFNSNINFQVTHRKTQKSIDNVVECDNRQVSFADSNIATTSTVIESRKSIVYESRDISDDDSDMEISELDNSIENRNENSNIVRRKRRGKTKKITKLETLRLKMLPKSKIKNDTKPVKKLRAKPIPINTVLKKKVTESDTAASLNDKSVYENAVKVVSMLRSSKEPKIIVEDCVIFSQYKSETEQKRHDENKEDSNSKSQSPIQINTSKKNKRKLSESLTNVPDNHTLNSNESSDFNDIKKGKKTGSSLNEEIRNKSPRKIKEKVNDIASRKQPCDLSDTEMPNTKRTYEEGHTSASSEAKEPKRKRTSVSDRNSKSNNNIIEPDSPRILRSSSNIKHSKETGVEIRERLRSKVDQNKTETHDNTSIISLGRKTRIARQHTQRGSESTKVEEHSLTESEIFKNTNKRATSYEDLNLFSIKNAQDQAVDQNKLETDETSSIIPLGRKSRIGRKNTRRSSESTEVEVHSPTVPEISINNNKRAVSYANLNLFSNEDTQDKTVDQNKLETDDASSISPLGRKPRIGRKNTRRDSESTQAEVQSPTVPETSKKKNKGAVSYADLNLFSNEDTQDQTVDQNKLEIDDSSSITSLENKPRITRNNRRRSSENAQVKASPTVPEISKTNNASAVSYADLNLFSNEDTQDQTVDQNKLEIDDSSSITSLENKPRITRNNRRRSSENAQVKASPTVPEISKTNNASAVSYADLNLFSNEDTEDHMKTADVYRKDSLLCRTIQKYGVQRMKFIAKQAPELKVNQVCKKLETSLNEIIEIPHEECLGAMKRLVAEIWTWNIKHFVLGFIKFLKHPERKIELFNKSICPPFPSMTKKEQVLLYVLDELQKSYDYRNVVQKILQNIEYTLFALNKASESYDVIETMSHFYALLCRSYHKISQLRLFIIDAMYCLQLRSVILVQQCLEVWMFVLPLGHMGLAKCPLVTCLVYLLHFYKCEDKYKRVQDIRNTLRWKYNYDLIDWNENMILDVFRTAIIEIRDSPMERKTLRLSLLILAKRHGAKWCHTNIVKNMLQPLINDSSTSDRAKQFCISLLGPLLKPYPSNMKVHYEMVIDYLMDMLHKLNSPKMQEAIISSLIYVDKNNNRLYQFLAKWSPTQMSPEFDIVFRDYVRSKTVHSWKQILSWVI